MKINESTAFGLQVATLLIVVMGGWAALSAWVLERGVPYGEMAVTTVVMLVPIAYHLYRHGPTTKGFWRRRPEQNRHR